MPAAMLERMPEAVRAATVALADAAPAGSYCVVAMPLPGGRGDWDVRVSELVKVRVVLASARLRENDVLLEELGRERPGCVPVLVALSELVAAGHVRLASTAVA